MTLWTSALESFRPTIPLDFWQFLDKFFFLSADATNSSGNWETLPYQKRLSYLFQDLDVKLVAFVKCAQIGYTQLIRGAVGYDAAHRGRNLCVYQPTATDATEFSALQIKSMLRDCPEIAKHLRVEHFDKKHPDNTNSRRVWERAISYFRGATSANEFRRISIDAAYLDELDGMPANVEGEGSPYSLARSRTYASSRPKVIAGSTPTIEGESNILSLAEGIHHKFYNYCPCPKCGQYQKIQFGGLDADFGLKWEKGSDHKATSDSVKYQCEFCPHQFGYEHLREIDEKGELRSETIGLTNDGKFYDLETGKACDPPHEAAVYLNGLLSYTISWSDGVYQFLKATDLARNGDNSALVTWTNEYLGEGYTPIQNKDLATWEDVMGRETESTKVPNWATHLTQWADVQKDQLHNMLVAWGQGERSCVVRYDIIQGDPTSGNLLEFVSKQALESFEREDGVMLPISLSGIDSGYLADTVYKACKADATKILPTKGKSVYGSPVVEMPNRPNSHGVYLCPIGTDTAKDIIAERLKIDVDVPGKIEFNDYEFINSDFYKSCTSNIKKTVFRSGKSTERWVLPSGRHDEGLDCLCGNLAMVRLLQQRYSVTLGESSETESNEDDFDMSAMIKAAQA